MFKYISLPLTQQVVPGQTPAEIAALRQQQQLEDLLLQQLQDAIATHSHHRHGGGGRRVNRRQFIMITASHGRGGPRQIRLFNAIKSAPQIPKEIRQPLARILDAVASHTPEAVTKELVQTLTDTLGLIQRHVHGKHHHNAHKLLTTIGKTSPENLLAVSKELQQVVKLPAEIHEPVITVLAALTEQSPQSVTPATVQLITATLTEIASTSPSALNTTAQTLTHLATESPKTLSTLFANDTIQLTKEVLTGLAKQSGTVFETALPALITAVQTHPSEAATILNTIATTLKTGTPAELNQLMTTLASQPAPDSTLLAEVAILASGLFSDEIDDKDRDEHHNEWAAPHRTTTDITASTVDGSSSTPSAFVLPSETPGLQRKSSRPPHDGDGSTDSLIDHFSATENTAWAQAAQFRKMLAERQ